MPHQVQQLLILRDAPEGESAIICRGLFSANYLQQHLAKAESFPAAAEVRSLYEVAKSRWEQNVHGLRKQKEAYTRSVFLDPMLADLGWQFIPEADLPKGPKTERPDYCLFPNAEARQQAAAQLQTADIFRFADTVLEAKKWQHPLDEVSKTETPGWFPSQQIQSYLRHAKDATGKRFFNWAILTNGNRWRLYCEQAANDAYFEFTLADNDQFCSLEDFRLFVALFRPAAFARRADVRCQLDDLRDEALTKQSELELSLRKRIFDVLEDLANGFRDCAANGITPADYGAVYDNALVLLYRLLFVLYAESRGLLPVKTHGYGANKVYREKFSLARLVNELRDQSKFADDAFTELYTDLLKLFHLINGDNEAQNQATRVTRYNGGLFNPQLHPRLETWRVGDAALAGVLKQLVFAQPPAKSSARQQQIVTHEAIDYASLEVRQLGDIYEGLLGAHLADDNGRLALRNENGQNHRHGIFYTPDWIVRYLLRETLLPLLDEIEAGEEVRRALAAKSEEKQRDNSFALGVLRLNLVDPAMGSGHFLVRATEWLAEQVVYHPTTRLMTEPVVANGPGRRTREEILAAGRIPVAPGISQEQAETAYWRRRVVEACIYGVDLNPLAVELAKLSLWLTCIAADEPLNFLDHHLRHGNSLLYAAPEELSHRPGVTEEEKRQVTAFDIGNRLPEAVRAVIAENVNIEQTASTEMELVKQKEQRWKEVRARLDPFLHCASIWLAALDGLPMNEHDYRLLMLSEVAPKELDNVEKARAKKLRESLAAQLGAKQAALAPFHWRLEFPDVFYEADGQARPAESAGFDAVLGNPPYISTHTSSAEQWRGALERRVGFLDDLYVHFTEQGFTLLRPGGGFGFIVSDTFFTLASKQRMRDLLQSHTLTHLGQCDPFDATVDAAIFVARKLPAAAEELLFIQARPRKTTDGRPTMPEEFLETLPPSAKVELSAATVLPGDFGAARHGAHGPQGNLRVHRVPVALYRAAHKRAFFEPRPGTLRLFAKFNEPVKQLCAEWWERIKTSRDFEEHLPVIREYQAGLKPGDITLIGLVAEGGQGMRTANNARFLGYLESTPQADAVLAKREAWTRRWLGEAAIKPVFLKLLRENGGDVNKPTKNSAAWEASVEPLRDQFTAQQLGFSKSDLYRVVPKTLVADLSHQPGSDSHFTWQKRKQELLARWRSAKELDEFWMATLSDGEKRKRAQKQRKAATVSDADFCLLCQELQRWIAEENQARKRRKQLPIPRDALGLHSSEDYDEPADAPRVATIYNGLRGHGQFVPFRKGDPEGNRWLDNEPLFIEWSGESVRWFFDNSGRPESGMPVMRNARLYLTAGVTWTAVANHVPMKARFQEPCVFDADSMRLTPQARVIQPAAFLALLNSDLVSFLKMKFIKHTQKWEIGDLRQVPLVMPTRAQASRLEKLAGLAMAAKRHQFAGQSPTHELAAEVRALGEELFAQAPEYLRPDAQRKLLATATDCLAVLELAVNWEAEKLYGVEGDGPFDEF
jgi:type I restriction-modification system DNA methylase subunit